MGWVRPSLQNRKNVDAKNLMNELKEIIIHYINLFSGGGSWLGRQYLLLQIKGKEKKKYKFFFKSFNYSFKYY